MLGLAPPEMKGDVSGSSSNERECTLFGPPREPYILSHIGFGRSASCEGGWFGIFIPFGSELHTGP